MYRHPQENLFTFDHIDFTAVAVPTPAARVMHNVHSPQHYATTPVGMGGWQPVTATRSLPSHMGSLTLQPTATVLLPDDSVALLASVLDLAIGTQNSLTLQAQALGVQMQPTTPTPYSAPTLPSPAVVHPYSMGTHLHGPPRILPASNPTDLDAEYRRRNSFPICPKPPRMRRPSSELKRAFVCTEESCGKRYENRRTLQAHMRKKHNTSLPPQSRPPKGCHSTPGSITSSRASSTCSINTTTPPPPQNSVTTPPAMNFFSADTFSNSFEFHPTTGAGLSRQVSQLSHVSRTSEDTECGLNAGDIEGFSLDLAGLENLGEFLSLAMEGLDPELFKFALSSGDDTNSHPPGPN